MNKVVIVIAIFSVLAVSVYAQAGNQCYECIDCPNPFKDTDPKVKKEDCLTKSECYKREVIRGSTRVIFKGCESRKSQHKALEELTKASTAETISNVCDGDLCNHSNSFMKASYTQIFFSFAAVLSLIVFNKLF